MGIANKHIPFLWRGLQISLLFLLSCSHPSPVREQLSRAEQMMETDSRAAALVLDSIDSSTLRGEEAALYAILRTQTDYKNYKPLTSDSLARIATDYYGTPFRKSYHAALAWYSLGCVYSDQGKVEEAFDAYLKAKPLFPDTSNRYFALCAQNIGYCYFNRTLFREAIEVFEEGKRSSLAGGDSAHVAVCDFDLGFSHLVLEEFDAADSCYDAVLANPYAKERLRQILPLNRAKLCYYHRKDTATAIHLLHDYIRTIGRNYDVGAAYYVLGTIYDECNVPDSASYYYEKSLRGNNMPYTVYNVTRNEISLFLRQHGDEEHARRFLQFVDLSESIFSSRNQAKLTALENDHRHELETEHMKRRLYLVVAAVVFLALASQWYRTYREKQKNKHYIRIYDELKASQMREERMRLILEEGKNQINRQQETDDFRNTLDVAVRQFKASPTWKIVVSIRDENKEPATNDRLAFYHDLNVCFSDVFTFLRQKGLSINNREQFIVACYALGLNSEESEKILHVKSSTIRVTKKRLIDKFPPEIGTLIFH
ncbi:MAG: tetratricopeptide repeat protein [Bacteroidaceae bacterium]|nr:tetratricopeptide repeat protein [Bacteroidaceae bacterium]